MSGEQVKPGYKRTEVGVIPDTWAVSTISKSMHLINGCAFKPHEWKKQGTPIIRIQNLNDPAANFNYFQGKVDEKNQVLAGDVLFAWSGTLGSSFGARIWNGPDGALNQHIFKVIADEKVFTKHFSYLIFKRVQEDIEKKSHGFKSSFVHVKKADIGNILLPIPPLSEQREIATALSDVDALLAQVDQLIAKKRDLKQAAMQQLLTGQTRLPGFSGEWEVKRLGDYFRFLKNGAFPRAELEEQGSIHYLHYGDIHSSNSVNLDALAASMPYLCESKARTLDRLERGDLVFADASEDYDGVGKSVEISNAGFGLVAGLHTIAIRFQKSILADDFKAYLQFMPSFRNHLLRLVSGTKVYATQRSHIASAELKLPPAQEQTAIATVLSDMDAELATLESRRDKTRALKQGMMQELLTGRIRLTVAHH